MENRINDTLAVPKVNNMARAYSTVFILFIALFVLRLSIPTEKVF